MNIFNQWRYIKYCLGFDDKPSEILGGNWCLICCICFLFSILFGIPLYPRLLNHLLKVNKGYAEKNLVIWGVVSKLLGIEFDLNLWNGKDVPSHIKPPSIISYQISESSKHFVVVISITKAGLLVFDPLKGNTRIFTDFNKLRSIINCHRLTNIMQTSKIINI